MAAIKAQANPVSQDPSSRASIPIQSLHRKSTMIHIRFPTLFLLLAATLCLSCNGFMEIQSCSYLSTARIRSTSGQIMAQHSPMCHRRSSLFMTDDSKEQENAKMKEVLDTKDEEENSAEGKRGVTKTILLAVPLFCKFVIVLLIKLITDLIVFPLLFLYRLAGLGKRKFLKMIGKGPEVNENPNGET